MRLFACWIVLCLCACGTAAVASKTVVVEPVSTHTVAEPSSSLAQDEVEAQTVLAAVAPPPVAPQPLSGEPALGVIDRAGLVQIIDKGLGRLFQRLSVTPAMKSGKFVGFQITAIDADWAASTLQEGDVITALNGQPIDRPEQAMSAFERLRQADELVLDLLRAGAPAQLRYRIE